VLIYLYTLDYLALWRLRTTTLIYFYFQFILQNFLYLFYPDLSIFYCFSLPILPYYKLRDSKGRFRSPKQKELKPIIPLSKEVMDPLIGN